MGSPVVLITGALTGIGSAAATIRTWQLASELEEMKDE
jgi:NAD(P)-dependent dehydrogenase (short-subunit alcohol dehydrogenase family)